MMILGINTSQASLLEAAILAAGLDVDAAAGARQGIRAGIDWVGQTRQDRIAGSTRSGGLQRHRPGGQWNALVSEPEVHLTQRLHLGEFGEEPRSPRRRADPGSRCGCGRPARSRRPSLAPTRLLLSASSERWRSTVSRSWCPSCRAVADRWAVAIVHAVLVGDQCADETAELEQRVRVVTLRARCVSASIDTTSTCHRWRPAASRSRAARRHRRSGRDRHQ